MARTLNIVAVGLIVLGAVAMAGPTFGFSTIAADRGVATDVANDQANALLGIDTVGGMVTLPNGDTRSVGTVSNNFGEDTINVGAEVVNVEGADASVVETKAVGEVSVGSPEEIVVTCGNTDEDLGERNVTFAATGEGSSVLVQSASFTVPIEIQCKPVLSGLEGTASTSGGSGKLNFNLNNTGNTDVTLVSASIQTKNNLENAYFTEDKVRFGGKSLNEDGTTVTLSPGDDPIAVELQKFERENKGGPEKFSPGEFTTDADNADIVITLDLADQPNDVKLYLNADYS